MAEESVTKNVSDLKNKNHVFFYIFSDFPFQNIKFLKIQNKIFLKNQLLDELLWRHDFAN